MPAPGHQAHPHQALHAQNKRQGRALHPDRASGLVRSVVEGGLSKADAAFQFNTTPKTVAKWVKRFLAEGVEGLRDRSSRPHSSPSQTPPATARFDQGQPLEAPHSRCVLPAIWGQGAEARKRDLSNKIQHSLKWKFAIAAAIGGLTQSRTYVAERTRPNRRIAERAQPDMSRTCQNRRERPQTSVRPERSISVADNPLGARRTSPANARPELLSRD
ncbi:helix-turn-helix domain-containing protein [Bradyrhizobium sp. 164]|nr:helix-turn-helix domain-containing protein [Bradyrhizobium sp. 164]